MATKKKETPKKPEVNKEGLLVINADAKPVEVKETPKKGKQETPSYRKGAKVIQKGNMTIYTF